MEGYSSTAYRHWELGTLSACHLGGQKLDVGKQDVLVKNGSCGIGFKGCNIKQSIYFKYSFHLQHFILKVFVSIG